ncbi:Tim10/DDP family zinc finger-domain-containing protein [Tribonema minus]|uniref:Mitochondrial import inner membrane translocase subunit n=1 Tax=Tribonema minus TaxID=303371 RepID=A0A835Z1H3_9STRA|nr:Tim10/DDP family zinc finger-domain-containing protein [Tribonema minus]
MSWFSKEPEQQQGPDKVEMAKTEVEMMTDLYNKMVDSCFSKCIANMKEGDLSVGEMSCVDRCVHKYLSAQEVVGSKTKEMEASMMPNGPQGGS